MSGMDAVPALDGDYPGMSAGRMVIDANDTDEMPHLSLEGLLPAGRHQLDPLAETPLVIRLRLHNLRAELMSQHPADHRARAG